MIAKHEPFLISVSKRRDPRSLQLLRRLAQSTEGQRLLRNAGLLEQILIIDEAVAFQVHRHTVELAVYSHLFRRERLNILGPGLTAQVLQIFQPHIAFVVAPDGEDIRLVTG
ncbi:hypothetical protein D3C80_1621820 [compost metagenome]